MKNKVIISRIITVVMLILSLMLFLSSCTIKYKYDKNPSRSGTISESFISGGPALKYSHKGGKILYGQYYEMSDTFLKVAEGFDYMLYIFVNKNKTVTIDYTAYAPTLPTRLHKKPNGQEVSVTYDTEVNISFSGFPDAAMNTYNTINIGPTGSSYSDTLSFTVPDNTVDATVSIEVACSDYFNETEGTTFEKHSVTYSFRINPPADAVATNITEASQNGGDSMTTVPTTVVLGVLTTAVAVGAAGVSAGASAAGAAGATGGASGDGGDGDNNSEEKKDEGSTYGMYVRKDFGDTIRRGDPEVSVYARMVEIKPDGTEIDRPDLTVNINITSGEALQVEGCSLVDNYKGALVSAPKDSTAERGTVVFTFTGEGGTFTNKVIFKIGGEPYISFPEQKSYSGTMFVEAIAGDGFTYEVKFDLIDFTKEPETIEFDCPDSDIDVTYEKLSPFSYKAIVVNNSAPQDNGMFAKPQNISVKLVAQSETEKADNSFDVILYPEGLSVRGKVEDEKLIVNTAENKGGGMLDPTIKATRIDVTLAVKGTDSKGKPSAIISKEGIQVGEFAGTDSATETLLTAFKYKVNSDQAKDGIYFIEPEVTLPETASQKYYVTLPITGNYEGQSYNLDVPVRLTGEMPEKPAGWQKEYDLLRRAVQRYGLTANGNAQELIRSAKNRTPFELSMIRRAIIEEGVEYYTKEASEFMALDSKLEKIQAVFDVIKWFGDQACSYLIIVYGGGPAVEAFVSPFKDYVLQLIGEAGASIYWGEAVDFNGLALMSSITTGIENTIANMITGLETPTPKKIAALVAGLAILNFSKHYMFTSDCKGDFCKSIIKTGGDMTVTAFKSALGMKLESLLKNEAFKRKVEGWVGEIIASGADKISSSEVMKKYLEEAFGIVGATVYENTVSRNEGQSLTLIKIPVGSSTIMFDPVENAINIAKMYFNAFCDILPFIESSSPKMPDYPIYY